MVSISAHADWKASINGETELTGMHWQNQVLPDTRTNRVLLNQKLPITIKNGRTWRIKLQPIALYDPRNVSKNEQFFWDVQEGYLQFQSLPWTIQAGWNVFNWGDTDVFNPLDVVNQKRYFDPFQSEKLGAPSLLIKREFENFFVEGLYIPKQRRTLLPGENSRWLPRDIYNSLNFRAAADSSGATYLATLDLPPVIKYHYARFEDREHALENNFGGRVKFRFPGFDWTIAGYRGAAPTPAVNPVEVGLLRVVRIISSTEAEFAFDDPVNGSDLWIKPVYYKEDMVGTSFTLVAGDFLFKGASAYTSPVHRAADLPAKTLENVLGVERTFAVGKGTLTTMAQGTYVKRGDRLDTNSVSLARMFERAAMGAVRWSPSEKFAFLGSYLRDIHYKGSVIHSDASYKIADGWKLKGAADFLSGKPATPIGTYARNDRFTISLNSQW